MIQRFFFYSRPWECSALPSIVRQNPNEGDDFVLCQIAKIGHPEELSALCLLANAALKAGLTPEDGMP